MKKCSCELNTTIKVNSVTTLHCTAGTGIYDL